MVSKRNPVPSRHPLERSLEADLGAWSVLHVKPNCEKLVANYLLHRDISFYLPLYSKKTRVGYFQRIRTTEVPLFRGYICFALKKQEHHLLYDSKKLVRIIEVTDQKTFVEEMQAVDRAIRSGEDLMVTPGLTPGRKVLILSGPLQGLEGVVVKRRKQSQLALSVTMFNQSVLVKLDSLTKVEVL